MAKKIVLPRKFLFSIPKGRFLFHGRNDSNNNSLLGSSSINATLKKLLPLRDIMFWSDSFQIAFLYMGTRPRREWQLLICQLQRTVKLIKISKESLRFIIDQFGKLLCRNESIRKGKTRKIAKIKESLQSLIKRAFPLSQGELTRLSFRDVDARLSKCICRFFSVDGFTVNDELPVCSRRRGNLRVRSPRLSRKQNSFFPYSSFFCTVRPPGSNIKLFHRETMICVPRIVFKISHILIFKTKKGKQSIVDNLLSLDDQWNGRGFGLKSVDQLTDILKPDEKMVIGENGK